MTNYQCVLFDLDGTLIDSAQDLLNSLDLLLANHQKQSASQTEKQLVSQAGSRYIIADRFKCQIEDAVYKKIRQEFFDIYLSLRNQNTVLFKGVKELLSQLEQHHIRWGIATNKPRPLTLPILEDLDLKPEVTVCSDDVQVPKPSAEMLLKATHFLNIPEPNCVYVGDTYIDFKSAQACDMDFIACLWGYPYCELKPNDFAKVAQKPSDINQILNL